MSDYVDQYLQQWPRPEPEPDPLIAKRNHFYQRFEPEKAERHWQRWLEQRSAIDQNFDRAHPYWQEYVRRKGWK